MARKTLKQRIEELEDVIGIHREIIAIIEVREAPGKYKETISGKLMTLETARKRYSHPHQVLLIANYKHMKGVEGECITDSTLITEKGF